MSAIAVAVDVGYVDVDFADIAEQTCQDGVDHELLHALAEQHEADAKASGHEGERIYCVEAARRLRELADWMRENAP